MWSVGGNTLLRQPLAPIVCCLVLDPLPFLWRNFDPSLWSAIILDCIIYVLISCCWIHVPYTTPSYRRLPLSCLQMRLRARDAVISLIRSWCCGLCPQVRLQTVFMFVRLSTTLLFVMQLSPRFMGHISTDSQKLRSLTSFDLFTRSSMCMFFTQCT